jgi:hypothetical protein
LLWFGFGLALVIEAGRNYPHYFLTLAPSLALAAALLVSEIEPYLAGSALRRQIAAIILAPALLAYVLQLGELRSLIPSKRFVTQTDLMAEKIRRAAGPSSSLLVWGYQPWLFYSTGLITAVRYTSTHYIYDSPYSYDSVGQDLLRRMRTTPPDFVVIVIAGFEKPSWLLGPDRVEDEFNAIIGDSYVDIDSVQGMRLLRRK